MKKLLILAVLVAFTACKTKTVYVPVESVKIEYRDKLLRDSIHLYDSIYIREKGDTVRIEKYRYLYRDKVIRDSIYLKDTIRVPYPVVEYKEVVKVNGWQNFQIWLGRILIGIILSFIAYKIVKRKLL